LNPDRIYREHRDDAFTKQVSAKTYSTFVAMPFGNLFSYRATQIYETVICAAAQYANNTGKAKRPFAVPYRVDKGPGTAFNISEEIVVSILETHFFVADLTLANHGVLVELGLALGLKPNARIVAVMQGAPSDLHFDLKHTNVLKYEDPTKAAEILGDALLSAAHSFEVERDLHVQSITKRLSPDAIICMNWYAHMQQQNRDQALHRKILVKDQRVNLPVELAPDESFERAYGYLADAVRELIDKRLFWCDYRVRGVPGGDAFGVHATDLGWVVIEHLWDLKRPV
jgi:hypothetical protein